MYVSHGIFKIKCKQWTTQSPTKVWENAHEHAKLRIGYNIDQQSDVLSVEEYL